MQILDNIHPSWRSILEDSLDSLESQYLEFLKEDSSYFPDRQNFLNAFKTLSLKDTKYILFGQDPYPRQESAIGYAFIDGKVKDIFGPNGLSKEVNRATSLRNFMKMALVCEGALIDDFSKEATSKINKTPYIDTIDQLRKNFEKNGVLLLNTALIFTSKEDSKKHIKAWRGFTQKLLESLSDYGIELILFGKAAEDIKKFKNIDSYKKHAMMHPYNISFITEPKAHHLFAPMVLLRF